MGPRRVVAAGLFQATSLSLILVATQIGEELGLLTSETSTALIGAGLLSVVHYPAIAMALLERDRSASRSSRPDGRAGPAAGPVREPGTG
jgi:hypothetical protein